MCVRGNHVYQDNWILVIGLQYNEKKKKLHGINMQWYWSTVRNMPQNVSTLCNCSVGQNYSNCCLASLKG